MSGSWTSRIWVVSFLVLALMALGCSEGTLGENDDVVEPSDISGGDSIEDNGNPSDGNITPNDTGQDNNPTDTYIPPTDTDTGTDQQATCTEGQVRCADDLQNVVTCYSNQWLTTQICEKGCENAECTFAAPTGSCSTPLPLPLNQEVIGTTDSLNFTATWLSSCSTQYMPTGTETVYRLDIPTAGYYDIDVTPHSQVYLAAYIRGTCEQSTTQLHQVCGENDKGTPIHVNTLLAKGTHYLIIDSFEENSDFGLMVSNATPEEDCYGQHSAILDPSSGQAQVTANTLSGTDKTSWNYSSSCPDAAIRSDGSENAFVFALINPSDVTITAQQLNPADSQIALYIRESCYSDKSGQLACDWGPDNSPATLTTRLDAGSYTVFVDDFLPTAAGGDEAQEYILTVQVN